MWYVEAICREIEGWTEGEREGGEGRRDGGKERGREGEG